MSAVWHDTLNWNNLVLFDFKLLEFFFSFQLLSSSDCEIMKGYTCKQFLFMCKKEDFFSNLGFWQEKQILNLSNPRSRGVFQQFFSLFHWLRLALGSWQIKSHNVYIAYDFLINLNLKANHKGPYAPPGVKITKYIFVSIKSIITGIWIPCNI